MLNAAARIVTGTRKFDRGLGQILHDELYWLHVPDRVFFKLAVTVHRCLNGRALHCTCLTMSRPPVLTFGDSCVPATVNFLQYTTLPAQYTYGCEAFSVAGPTVWNSPGF